MGYLAQLSAHFCGLSGDWHYSRSGFWDIRLDNIEVAAAPSTSKKPISQFIVLSRDSVWHINICNQTKSNFPFQFLVAFKARLNFCYNRNKRLSQCVTGVNGQYYSIIWTKSCVLIDGHRFGMDWEVLVCRTCLSTSSSHVDCLSMRRDCRELWSRCGGGATRGTGTGRGNWYVWSAASF